jgi:mono/diheme cytochrome c family protein
VKSILSLAVAVALLTVSMLVATQPVVQPPVEAGTAARITRFGVDHPEWRIFTQPRIDATPLRFEHAVHMNPQTPQMQGRLKAWAEAGAPGVVADETGVLTMSCVTCHATDDAGRYMKPIVFEQHCASCHGLGERGGEPIPHGRDAAAFAERIAAKTVLTPKPAAPAPSRPAAGPRGPAGPRPAPAAPAADTPTLTDQQAQDKFAKAFEDEKARLLRGIGQSCTKCHGRAGLDPATVASPDIPDRWLPRSVFGHNAHAFMACADCHADAAALDPSPANYPTEGDPPSGAWTGRTRDIMLPDMHSCTGCHSPTPTQSKDPARHDCALCHIYHPR